VRGCEGARVREGCGCDGATVRGCDGCWCDGATVPRCHGATVRECEGARVRVGRRRALVVLTPQSGTGLGGDYFEGFRAEVPRVYQRAALPRLIEEEWCSSSTICSKCRRSRSAGENDGEHAGVNVLGRTGWRPAARRDPFRSTLATRRGERRRHIDVVAGAGMVRPARAAGHPLRLAVQSHSRGLLVQSGALLIRA
jgi:hypothetical protein